MKPAYLRIIIICLIFSMGLSPFEIQAVQASSQSSWPIIDTLLIVGGLENPVHITNAGDGSGRLFVVEQRGRIRILENNVVQSTFLDISDRVRSPSNGGGTEEGLLSVAFPPGFGSGKPYFYVYYTLQSGDNRLSRFTVSGNPNLADPGSEMTILGVEIQITTHRIQDHFWEKCCALM
jgi:hypothetical protein